MKAPFALLHRQLLTHAPMLLRFGVVGVLATLLHVGTVVVAVELFFLDPRLANIVGYSLAFPFAYLAHYHFSFTSSHDHGPTSLRFVGVSLACFFVGQGLMHFIHGQLGLPYEASLAAMVIILPLISFLLNRFFVFDRYRGSSLHHPPKESQGGQ